MTTLTQSYLLLFLLCPQKLILVTVAVNFDYRTVLHIVKRDLRKIVSCSSSQSISLLWLPAAACIRLV